MRHCATCNCADDGPVQPATSSEWARRQALEAAAAAVQAAREKRTTRVTAGHADDAQEESNA